MTQKKAVEDSSTPVCSTSLASVVVPTANAGSLKLAAGFRNFENDSFRRLRKIEIFYDGKIFNILKKYRAMAKVMVRGKMWFWRFHILTFKSVNDRWLTMLNFRDLLGDCPRARRFRSIPMRPIKCEHAHTRSDTAVLNEVPWNGPVPYSGPRPYSGPQSIFFAPF